MARGLPAPLIRKYKNAWELLVSRRTTPIAPKKSRTSQQNAWLRFEVKKNVFALPTVKHRTRFHAIVDYIYYLNLVDDLTGHFLKQLGLIHWFLKATQLEMLSERLYEFCWHLVGPSEVRMDRTDERNVLACVNLLGDLGEHCAILGYRVSVTKQVLDTMFDLYQIGKAYKRKTILLACQKRIRGMEKEWREGTKKYGHRAPKGVFLLFGRARSRMSH
jgi:hypothetical protein